MPYLFADWISDYTTGTNTAFNEDADGDGKENGLEHAFSTDPLVRDTSGISQLAVFVFGSSACLVDGNGSVSAPTMLKVKRLS